MSECTQANRVLCRADVEPRIITALFSTAAPTAQRRCHRCGLCYVIGVACTIHAELVLARVAPS